ncbi:hypothetical protein [Peribacillus simplex]|uniref:hypothetical protein n=1 Tax=Peribacillus simplex TaxID=1478 RepID=UPI000A71B291|nr:hypothetical protein [Peribacillus simplex]MEC1398081.1 hypothetical protein [Peribacillus simplex]
MKKVKVILVIFVLALSAYQLITGNFELMPYSMLFLGAIMLVTGLVELQEDKKVDFWGVLLSHYFFSLFPCRVSF